MYAIAEVATPKPGFLRPKKSANIAPVWGLIFAANRSTIE